MLRNATRAEHPTVAIVVSDESADYRNEMAWLAAAVRRLNLADAWLRRPEEITFTEEGLFIRHDDGREVETRRDLPQFRALRPLQRSQTGADALRRAA